MHLDTSITYAHLVVAFGDCRKDRWAEDGQVGLVDSSVTGGEGELEEAEGLNLEGAAASAAALVLHKVVENVHTEAQSQEVQKIKKSGSTAWRRVNAGINGHGALRAAYPWGRMVDYLGWLTNRDACLISRVMLICKNTFIHGVREQHMHWLGWKKHI